MPAVIIGLPHQRTRKSCTCREPIKKGVTRSLKEFVLVPTLTLLAISRMFTSSWGQQNQQQQPQQQTGAFGQPTGFGATTSNNNGRFFFFSNLQTSIKTSTEPSVRQVLLLSPSNSNLRLIQCLEILELPVLVCKLLPSAI